MADWGALLKGILSAGGALPQGMDVAVKENLERSQQANTQRHQTETERLGRDTLEVTKGHYGALEEAERGRQAETLRRHEALESEARNKRADEQYKQQRAEQLREGLAGYFERRDQIGTPEGVVEPTQESRDLAAVARVPGMEGAFAGMIKPRNAPRLTEFDKRKAQHEDFLAKNYPDLVPGSPEHSTALHYLMTQPIVTESGAIPKFEGLRGAFGAPRGEPGAAPGPRAAAPAAGGQRKVFNPATGEIEVVGAAPGAGSVRMPPGRLGVEKVPPDRRKMLDTAANLLPLIDNMALSLEKISGKLPEPGIISRLKGGFNLGKEGLAQTDADLNSVMQDRDFLQAQIARLAGEVGVLTEFDAQRATSYLPIVFPSMATTKVFGTEIPTTPQLPDTPQVARQKLTKLRRLLENRLQRYAEQGPVPGWQAGKASKQDLGEIQ